MNRKERRAAKARARSTKRDFYTRYIRHLPELPPDAPIERGRVYHLVHMHDELCRFFVTGNPADCNCDVVVKRHVEPRRS